VLGKALYPERYRNYKDLANESHLNWNDNSIEMKIPSQIGGIVLMQYAKEYKCINGNGVLRFGGCRAVTSDNFLLNGDVDYRKHLKLFLMDRNVDDSFTKVGSSPPYVNYWR
jgi:hypothetical protein